MLSISLNRMQALITWLKTECQSEPSRPIIGWALSFAAGCALYLNLPFEPNFALVVLMVGMLGALYWLCRRSNSGKTYAPYVLLIAMMMAGMARTQLSTHFLPPPLPMGQEMKGWLEGNIQKVERMSGFERVWLSDVVLQQRHQSIELQGVRLRTFRLPDDIRSNDRVRVRVVLRSPPPLTWDNGYDSARDLYFRNIQAVGYATSRMTRVSQGGFTVRTFFEDQQRFLGDAIQRVLTNPEMGVAMALIAGEARAVEESVQQSLRVSGLAHVLSISGLHVGLMSGVVYFVIRALLALIPFVALRYPIKQYAAVVAWLAAVGYTLLAGAPVPTQRALLMLTVVWLAVIVGRQAISLNTWAMALLAVLLVQPASIGSISFQLSFTAVMVLIAYHEYISLTVRQSPSWLKRTLVAGVVVVMASLVVDLATKPFAVYHFQQWTWYAVVANTLSLPLLSLWIMPLVVLSLVAIPLGLGEWPLQGLSVGIDMMLQLARWVESWPAAMSFVPALQPWQFTIIIVCIIFMALLQSRLRLLMLVPMVVVVMSYLVSTPPPYLMIHEGGGNLAISQRDVLYVQHVRRNSFEVQQWQRRVGAEKILPLDRAPHTLIQCDDDGCYLPQQQWLIAWTERGAQEGCLMQQTVLMLSHAVTSLALRDPGCHVVSSPQNQHWIIPLNVRVPVSHQSSLAHARPWARK